ncbi:hypothetical protein MA16_Dca010203 [Dendrobium catenatum]|uniref:Uncharacterized protein n=1 Tax=Dendrobium catenatum TaxID=906689 RepID=A0A2I0WAF6_9ASPA|nr:hypothetical protein MA16_Dca010203 [Dendrobium catenatum]
MEILPPENPSAKALFQTRARLAYYFIPPIGFGSPLASVALAFPHRSSPLPSLPDFHESSPTLTASVTGETPQFSENPSITRRYSAGNDDTTNFIIISGVFITPVFPADTASVTSVVYMSTAGALVGFPVVQAGRVGNTGARAAARHGGSSGGQRGKASWRAAGHGGWPGSFFF